MTSESICQRIRELRKNVLKLTQQEFSDRLKISRSNLGNIETGRVEITDRNILDICDEFNVSEKWLRTGEKPMFSSLSEKDEISEMVHKILNDDTEFSRRIISVLCDLSTEELNLLDKMAHRLAQKYSAPMAEQHPTSQSVEEAEAEYIKSCSNFAQKMESSASSTTADTQTAERHA